jgi:hypothetical protein
MVPPSHANTASRRGIQATVGASSSNDPDFTDEFCGFLQRCVANVDAAELLLALSREPERSWRPAELAAQLESIANLADVDLQRALDAFQGCGLTTRDAEQRVRYQSSPNHDSHLATLARLYVERPVTLFRTIYALRDTKISTFADAFKLRR